MKAVTINSTPANSTAPQTTSLERVIIGKVSRNVSFGAAVLYIPAWLLTTNKCSRRAALLGAGAGLGWALNDLRGVVEPPRKEFSPTSGDNSGSRSQLRRVQDYCGDRRNSFLGLLRASGLLAHCASTPNPSLRSETSDLEVNHQIISAERAAEDAALEKNRNRASELRQQIHNLDVAIESASQHKADLAGRLKALVDQLHQAKLMFTAASLDLAVMKKWAAAEVESSCTDWESKMKDLAKRAEALESRAEHFRLTNGAVPTPLIPPAEQHEASKPCYTDFGKEESIT